MSTPKNTPAVQAEPTPVDPTPTSPITLPEMPPAETFKGLIAYAVDTATNESKQLSLEFLAEGVEACIEATANAVEQTEQAKAATAAADTATTNAIEAAETANTEAANLSDLKQAVAEATTAATEQTEASRTQTAAATKATTAAQAATTAAIEQIAAAATATEGADAAAARANEAAQNITDDVSALVPYVGANLLKCRPELSGFTYHPIEVVGLKAGGTYTFSCVANCINYVYTRRELYIAYDTKSGGTGEIKIAMPLSGSITDLQFAETFTVPADFVSVSSSLLIVLGTGGSVTIANIKLEVGSKATPYMPNPADIARAIDYSLLTEQIVPGEFWIDTNGVKKQVYARTWRGTTPDTWSVYGSGSAYEFKYFVLPASKLGCSAVWLEVGMIGAPVTGAVLNTIPLKNTNPIQVTYSDYLGGIVVSTNETASLTSKPYSITVKYIK